MQNWKTNRKVPMCTKIMVPNKRTENNAKKRRISEKQSLKKYEYYNKKVCLLPKLMWEKQY